MHHRALTLPKLGVLGGGQLGQLLFRQAQQWGVPVSMFEGSDWQDTQAIKKFISQVDVVLLENEFVPPAILRGANCFPTLASYEIFRDKLLEKELALKVGLETPRFSAVGSLEEVKQFLLTGTGILKARTGGYDGYGNLTVNTSTPEKAIQEFLARGPCIIEEQVSFAMEVAVLVARSADKSVTFPVAETLQENHICHSVVAPARLAPALLHKIAMQAQDLVAAADGVGIFGVEFFITHEFRVLYNETAPRPHNSAHFTLDACSSSQYALLVQIALGLPITTPHMTCPSVGMLNLLGTSAGTGELRPLEKFLSRGSLWMYGKKESRPGRKMGHYTLSGNDPQEILEHFKTLKEYQL